MFVVGMQVICHNPDEDVLQRKGWLGTVTRPQEGEDGMVLVFFDKIGEECSMFPREVTPVEMENE